MRCAFLVSLVIVVGPSYARDPYNVESALQQMISPATTVDHLLPVHEAYDDADKCTLSFRREPSFERFTRWCLVLTGDKAVIQSWLSNSTRAHGARSVTYKEMRSAISLPAAHGLQDIWLNTLMETRYPAFAPEGVDGDDYYFAAWVASTGLRLQGYVWLPRSDGPPKWLAALGDEITEYVRSNNGNSKKLESEIEVTRNRVFAYYRLNSQH